MTTPTAQFFAGWTADAYDALATRLAHHATRWLTAYFMRGRPLPKGKTVEDVVADSVESVVTGRRRWDQARHPDLETFLKMVIASEVRNLMKAKERQLVRRMSVDGDTAAAERGAPREEDIPSDEALQDALLEQAEHEEAINDRLRAFRAALDVSVKQAQDREDMEYILMAMEDGHLKPAQIEIATDLPRQRIHKLLERMRLVAAKLQRETASPTGATH